MDPENKDMAKISEGEDLLFGGHVKPIEKEQTYYPVCGCSRKRVFVISIILIMFLLYALGLGIGLAIGLSKRGEGVEEPVDLRRPTGVVVSDHEACSDVGRQMLHRGGTAVDAALATLICNGVRTPHSMGIGGGCLMVVYDKSSQTSVTIDGREMAPWNMTSDLYAKMKYKNARRIAVPGELKAYKLAHNLYGRLPWKDLFQPTIKMAEDGVPLSNATSQALLYVKAKLNGMGLGLANFTLLCEIFCSDLTTGTPKKMGDMIYFRKLAVTLRNIANQGPDYLYSSSSTNTIVAELKELGGVLDQLDFAREYKVIREPALKFDLGDYTLHTMGGATGGPVVGLITNIMEEFKLSKSDLSSTAMAAEVYHKVIEAIKFTYADRTLLDYNNYTQVVSKMNSEAYAKHIHSRITAKTHDISYYTDIAGNFMETEGTSHVSVLSPYGDAVSVTSTINWYFGSLEVSNSTGIIWNNEMDDFSTGKGGVNHIEPGKRPRSSMSPLILTDKHGNVRLVTGGAGGTKIPTSTAQVITRWLYLNQPIKVATEEKRFHHTLSPNNLVVENGFPEDIRVELAARGHNITDYIGPYMAVVESISVDNTGVISAYADSRKQPGNASYLYDDDER